MEIKKCFNCGHVQEVNKDNVYQDIKGTYTVCESCNASYDVELNEDGKHSEILQSDDKFRYMLLSRLQSDCNYYLGYGNRGKKALWAGDEKEQIEEMKVLWSSFDDDKKPEWLTWEEILDYENKMVQVND